MIRNNFLHVPFRHFLQYFASYYCTKNNYIPKEKNIREISKSEMK